MLYDDAGSMKETMQVLGGLNRRLHLPAMYFLRFSGEALLIFIFYLQFFFHALNPSSTPVWIWGGCYFGYILVLNLLRVMVPGSYDSNPLRILRIFTNTILISALVYVSPSARPFTTFLFIFPFLTSVLYFPDHLPGKFMVFFLAATGLLAAKLLGQPTTFDPLQYTMSLGGLGILFWGVSSTYRAAMSFPERLEVIARRLHSTLDISVIVDEIADAVLASTSADSLAVIIIDPDNQTYAHHKLVNLHLNPQTSINTLIQNCQVLRAGRSYEFPDIVGTPQEGYFGNFFDPPPRSLLLEPIFARQGAHVMGLVLIAKRQPVKFDLLTKRLFRQFCVLASGAVENSLVYRKARLGIASTRSVTHKLLGAETEDEINQLLVEEAVALIERAESCYLHRFDIESQSLAPVIGLQKDHSSGHGEPFYRKPKTALKLWEGIAGHALGLEETIFAPDVTKHPWFVPGSGEIEFRSLISTPLVSKEDGSLLGTLSVTHQEPNAFTPEDEATLVSLAAQGAISINRARDFEKWRLSGGYQMSIYESMQRIDLNTSEAEVCHQLTELASQVLPFKVVRMRLLDEARDELVTVALAGVPGDKAPHLMGHRLPYSRLAEFLKQEYMIERSYLISSEAPGWKEFADSYLYIPSKGSPNGWDSYDSFFTPLLSKESKLFGFIAWDSPKDGQRPSQQVIEAVGVFAAMAGLTLELARAQGRINSQQALLFSFVNSITEKLASAASAVGEVTVNLGSQLLNAEACSLYLVKEGEIELVSSTYLKNTEFIGRRKPVLASPGSGLSSWVAATQEMLCFDSHEEYASHPGWAGETGQLQYMPSNTCANLLLVPLRDPNGRCRGVLSFENHHVQKNITPFSENDCENAMRLADQVSLALDLEQRFKEVKTWEQEVLEDDLHELKNLYEFGIRVRIENAQHWLADGSRDDLAAELDALDSYSTTFLNELYSLHNTVQKKYYEYEHFPDALRALAKNLSTRDPRWREDEPQISIECPEHLDISPLLRYALVRIASGALLNAIVHSGVLKDPSIQISVSVIREEDAVVMVIKDTGVGMKKVREGYGIRRMRTLVRELNRQGFTSRLNFFSEPDRGTEVRLKIKLEETNPGNLGGQA